MDFDWATVNISKLQRVQDSMARIVTISTTVFLSVNVDWTRLPFSNDVVGPICTMSWFLRQLNEQKTNASLHEELLGSVLTYIHFSCSLIRNNHQTGTAAATPLHPSLNSTIVKHLLCSIPKKQKQTRPSYTQNEALSCLVITTMVIRPLDDPTWCAQSMIADLRPLSLGYVQGVEYGQVG